eukprot:1845923-Pleurochrysis_carterae.AAC.1
MVQAKAPPMAAARAGGSTSRRRSAPGRMSPCLRPLATPLPAPLAAVVGAEESQDPRASFPGASRPPPPQPPWL